MGISRYQNGSSYKGEWNNDERTGRGVVQDKDQTRYIGMFFRGKLDGHGTSVSLDEKESYVGAFRMGKRHGQGRYVFRNGDVYEGECKDD